MMKNKHSDYLYDNFFRNLLINSEMIGTMVTDPTIITSEDVGEAYVWTTTCNDWLEYVSLGGIK